MSVTAKDVFDFVVVGVLLKALIAKLLLDHGLRLFKRLFVRRERDMAIWLHYRNKRLRNGHTDEKIKPL